VSGFEGDSSALVGGRDYLNSRVLLCVFAGDGEALVDRAIVPNYQFKVGVGLGENAISGGAEVLFSVVGGGNYGDWRGHWGFLRRRRSIALSVNSFDVFVREFSGKFLG